jgi:hypothetical protein
MSAKFYPITQEEMTEFLTSQGFQLLDLKGVYELVFGKIVYVDQGKLRLTLRVFTAINKPFTSDTAAPLFHNGQSREKGKDAIRVQLFWRKFEGFEPILVGKGAKCLRVENWRDNMLKAIKTVSEQTIASCPKCQAPMAKRKGKYGEFWGCSTWKTTKCSGKR